MSLQFVMGNEAIGLAAIHAGVNVVAGYPGTPSTEILETIAKNNAHRSIYVEWSINEKAAMELAAGASYAGARTLVTMKQVGLNVASDPLMSLAYVGVKGGMVIVVADDPGPISSQTEQDTRHFAQFSKLPVFDPSSPEEAFQMMSDAFAVSEKYGTPVLFRPTTRVCHGCTSMEIPDDVSIPEASLQVAHKVDGFVKDSKRWVIFPRASYLNHIKIEKRNATDLNDDFSRYPLNRIIGCGNKGIVTGGISYEYVMEACASFNPEADGDFVVPFNAKVFKVATPHPFPEKRALEFLRSVDEVIAVEELDPVLEDELIFLCGKYHLNVTVHGKHDGAVQNAGENTVESVKASVSKFLGIELDAAPTPDELPELPVRPPVLCAGCPHRGSFYAVKQAMKGKRAVFCGDIGCYTLGNAAPLDMCDTCLCMGADITIAQGIYRAESGATSEKKPEAVNFSFIGDSTFFASGITGIVNAVYNQTPIVVCVLDNSTTAMTGQQPHPGTGITMMGDVVAKVSIEKILNAVGVKSVETVNPFDLKTAVAAVQKAADLSTKESCVTAIIFKSPCIAVAAKLAKEGTLTESVKNTGVVPGSKKYVVAADKCKSCRKCINELGCPALVIKEGKAFVEPSLCFGCSLCEQVCPFGAISEGSASGASVSATGASSSNAGGAK